MGIAATGILILFPLLLLILPQQPSWQRPRPVAARADGLVAGAWNTRRFSLRRTATGASPPPSLEDTSGLGAHQRQHFNPFFSCFPIVT